MIPRISFSSMLLIACCMLSACGFHLRGLSAQYPPTFGPIALQIEHADHGAWEPLLRQQFMQANLQVVDDVKQAQSWLTVLDEQTTTTIVSISSSSSPRQYQLIYTVTFSLQQRQMDLIAPTTLRITRPITINNDRILGSHDEENKLTQDIRREAASQMLDRINRRAWSTLIKSTVHTKA